MFVRQATQSEIVKAHYKYHKVDEIDIELNAAACVVPGKGVWVQAWVLLPEHEEKVEVTNGDAQSDAE